MKAIYLVFKFSPVGTEDYLKIDELLHSLKSKSVAYLFPQKFCGRRWLENGKPFKRTIESHSYFKRYSSSLKVFISILDKMIVPLPLATLEFSLFTCNEI